MAGRASIVGAAATHVGKVREHNEDCHFLDADLGMFLVCDGMGGHAAGEVASAIAVRQICEEWASIGLRDVAEQWLERGTPAAKKRLLDVVRAGVIAAHRAILAEAQRDRSKMGMGTTLVGGMVIGGEAVFAHAGDSRAYLVRDGISMQLTEDHTLLARLLAAGIDVDVSGEGSRFRSMLTNALGIGDEVKVSTFVVPLADGDRFLLCSDGISEYVPENEVGEVLSKQGSPGRAAQRLVDLALERGGGDNATAVVVRVLEAGEIPLPAEQRKRDDAVIASCPLWGGRVNPQMRLRALRIAIPRDHAAGDKLPPHTLGDRVAWIVVEGELVQDGQPVGPGALIYPDSLIAPKPGEAPQLPERDALALARGEVRALAIRADDFRELCEDDGELGEALIEALTQVVRKKKARVSRPAPVDPSGETDPQLRAVSKRDVDPAYLPTDPSMQAVDEAAVGDTLEIEVEAAPEAADVRDRAATVPDEPRKTRPWPKVESAVIVSVEQAPPVRPSPPPAQLTKRVAPPAPGPENRPSPLPTGLTARTPAAAPPVAKQATPAKAAPPVAKQATPASAAPPLGKPGAEAKPAAAEAKPGATEAKPGAATAEAKPGATEAKPGATTEAKPAAAEAKPVATEAKPAAATAAEAKPAAAAAEAKPAAAAEAKPAELAPAAATPAPARKTAHLAPRATPSSGTSPVADAAPAFERPASGGDSGMKPSGEPSWASPGDWDELTERIGPPRRTGGLEASAPTATPTLKGFAPALTPPSQLADATPSTEIRAQARPSTSPPRARYRPPTEPEIETYLEMEAELPPSAADELPPALAFGSATKIPRDDAKPPPDEIDEEHAEVSITIEDDSTRVTETVTETSFHTLIVTVTESVTEAPVAALRPRMTTAERIISGTIDEPAPGTPPTQPPRAKRHSGGWDE